MVMQHPIRIDRMTQDGVTTISLQIGDNAFAFNGTEADALLEHLSLIRAAMRPAVPPMLSSTHSYLLEMNADWYAEPSQRMNGIVLFLRHSGYGWTGSGIPQHQLAPLLATFNAYLESPAPDHQLPN
jgi:hypothetical protein